MLYAFILAHFLGREVGEGVLTFVAGRDRFSKVSSLRSAAHPRASWLGTPLTHPKQVILNPTPTLRSPPQLRVALWTLRFALMERWTSTLRERRWKAAS